MQPLKHLCTTFLPPGRRCMHACTLSVIGRAPAPQLLAALDTQDLRAGFRVPGLVRFGAATDAYIGNTNGGPRMYVTIEDHLSHSTGERNRAFEVGQLGRHLTRKRPRLDL